jgi:hypothetical protein
MDCQSQQWGGTRSVNNEILYFVVYCSAFTDKPQHNFKFPAPSKNWMIRHQVQQDFSDTSQILLPLAQNFLIHKCIT